MDGGMDRFFLSQRERAGVRAPSILPLL